MPKTKGRSRRARAPKDANEAKLAGRRGREEPLDPEEAPEAEQPTAPPPVLTDERWRWLGEREGWLDRRPPPRQYLLTRDGAGVLGCGEVAVLTGAGAAGKSRAVTQLAVAVATGTEWLGRFQVARPGRVLLAMAEEAEDDVRRLVYRAALPLRRELRGVLGRNLMPLALKAEAVYLAEGGSGYLVATPFWRELTERLASAKDWSLLVLDPAVSFAPAEAEKDNAIAQRWINALARLATDTPGGPTVLQTHHTNKMSRRRPEDFSAVDTRGVSALTDGPRWAAGLAPAMRWVAVIGGKNGKPTFKRVPCPEHMCLKVTKVNHAPVPEPVFLRRGEEGVLLPLTDEEVRMAGLTEPDPLDEDPTPTGAAKPQPRSRVGTGSARGLLAEEAP